MERRMFNWAFMTNELVAWPIGDRRLAERYLEKYYLPPDGWRICTALPGRWKLEPEFGSLRRIKKATRHGNRRP